MSVHHGAAEAPRGLDCEADESDAELKYAVGLSYREPVPEPGACLIQWVDAHCPHDLAGDQRHQMQCLGVVVVGVAIASREEALLNDEDLVPDARSSHYLSSACGLPEQRGLRGADAGHVGGRTESVSGTALVDDSRDCSPLHAWQRAQPALEMPLCIPLRAI